MHWSKPREIRARLVEASRESRETMRCVARVSRDKPREVARRTRDVEKIYHNAPETRWKQNESMLLRCKSCRLQCLRCSWTNYFEFSVTAIAKFAPAITTYGGSSFHNEVGTCYCRQIRYLIMMHSSERYYGYVTTYSHGHSHVTGTSHLMSMLFQ